MNQTSKNDKLIQWIGSLGLFIIGLFAADVVKGLAPSWWDKTNLPIVSFVLVALLFFITTLLWGHIVSKLASIAESSRLLASSVGHSVRVLPQLEGYDVVRERTLNAKHEVLKLIYYEADSDGKPLYDASLLHHPKRRLAYETERQRLLGSPIRDGFKYVEIVQLNSGCALTSILENDPIYAEHCKYLAELGKKSPEVACLRVSEVVLPNTIIIVDGSFLYIALHAKKPGSGETEYPFVGLAIEDPDAQILKDLVTLHKRTFEDAKLMRRID